MVSRKITVIPDETKGKWHVRYFHNRKRRQKTFDSAYAAEAQARAWRKADKAFGHPEPKEEDLPKSARSLQSLFDEWYQVQEARTTISAKSLTNYRNGARPALEKFGRVTANDIGQSEVNRWLGRLDRAQASKATISRLVRMVYRYHGLESPFEGLAASDGSEVEFYSVPQARALLKHTDDQFKGVLAALLFAGIRPEEAERMTIANFDLPGKRILVRAEQSKTRHARLIESPGIPETVFRWVESYGYNPANYRRRIRRLRDVAQDLGFDWIQDGCRHTFMTYMVAMGRAGDAVKAAGHLNSGMAQRHYVNFTVSRVDGEAFFTSLPEPTGSSGPASQALPVSE